MLKLGGNGQKSSAISRVEWKDEEMLLKTISQHLVNVYLIETFTFLATICKFFNHLHVKGAEIQKHFKSYSTGEIFPVANKHWLRMNSKFNSVDFDRVKTA